MTAKTFIQIAAGLILNCLFTVVFAAPVPYLWNITSNGIAFARTHDETRSAIIALVTSSVDDRGHTGVQLLLHMPDSRTFTQNLDSEEARQLRKAGLLTVGGKVAIVEYQRKPIMLYHFNAKSFEHAWLLNMFVAIGSLCIYMALAKIGYKRAIWSRHLPDRSMGTPGIAVVNSTWRGYFPVVWVGITLGLCAAGYVCVPFHVWFTISAVWLYGAASLCYVCCGAVAVLSLVSRDP